MNVIAIFDIGKTNKKVTLFDEAYNIVSDQSKQFDEIIDDNGEKCDDIEAITMWITDTVAFLKLVDNITIKAINVSAYGASFVHIDNNFEVLTPLYNYLNSYPASLQQRFYDTYGGEVKVSKETASPVLGNLNSGMQLYRIKHERPHLFKKIKYSLHLPQYVSHIISGVTCADITSIGCHTNLWNFETHGYHEWVSKEGIDKKFPKILKSDEVVYIPSATNKKGICVGGGLHDSSAALIPYFTTFHEPFLLISTGTWCISLNAFNDSPLTEEELKKDCLCYMSYLGKPVKASRLFAGNEHEIQTKKIAAHFKKRKDHFKNIEFNKGLADRLNSSNVSAKDTKPFTNGLQRSVFESRDLSSFESYEEAYHQLMIDIMKMQKPSTELVLKNTGVKRIFVDGGFSKNPVYMNLLSEAFPTLEVFGATIAQSTSIGAALAIHHHWNSLDVPKDLIALKRYP